MIAEIRIPSRLPSTNEMLRAERAITKRGLAPGAARGVVWNTTKKKFYRVIGLHALAQRFPRVSEPVHVEIEFADDGRDPDNVIGGGMKVLLDALVRGGFLPDDGPEWILSLRCSWRRDSTPSIVFRVRSP